MSRSKVTTGHNPSPYLRRYRIPQLNTVRVHDDPCTPEDEDGKMEMIREKMNELAQRSDQRQSNQAINQGASTQPSTSESKRCPPPESSLRGSEHQAYRNQNSKSHQYLPPSSYSTKKFANPCPKVSKNPTKPTYLQFEVSNLRWKNGFV